MGIDYAKLRTNMVDNQLRTTDVTDHAVLDAMGEVPREAFVPAALRPLAYIDEDIRLPGGRYVIEPSPFAKLVQLAGVRAGDFILDVGCATGYSAAVLSRLASSVIALEEDEALAATATETLSDHGFDNVAVVTGPLTAGYAAEGPYDLIMVEGAVETVPQALIDQMRDGGRMVVVEGHGNAAAAWLYVRDGDVVSRRRGFNCAVKSLPGFSREAEFVF